MKIIRLVNHVIKDEFDFTQLIVPCEDKGRLDHEEIRQLLDEEHIKLLFL